MFVLRNEKNFNLSTNKKSPAFLQNFFCEPGRIRTFDRLLRREVLYPAELRAHSHGYSILNPWSIGEYYYSSSSYYKSNKNFVGVAGFEPATSSSQTRRDDRATLHPEILLIFSIMRRDGDSNPGYPIRVRLFSKQVLSATQAPLLFNEHPHKGVQI